MKSNPPNRSLAMVLAALALTLSVIQEAQAASWVINSPMANGRKWHTATLLPTGKVLVAGGITNYSGPYYLTSASAEQYDPGSGQWTAVNPSPGSTPASKHSSQSFFQPQSPRAIIQ